MKLNKEEIKEEKVESENEEIKDEEVDFKEEEPEKELSKKEKKAKAKEQKTKEQKEIEELNAKISKLEDEIKFQKNEYLKVFAEMENTKKRLKEEAVKDRKYASQKVVGELVTPIDMLVQIVNMPATSPEVSNYQIGFQMIAKQLVDILEAEGLKKIDADGKEFNPDSMQAMSTEWNSEKPENVVLKVMQQGYFYKDRVLKPAMVVVNKKPVEAKDEKEGN